jgi:hypothetical protein
VAYKNDEAVYFGEGVKEFLDDPDYQVAKWFKVCSELVSRAGLSLMTTFSYI